MLILRVSGEGEQGLESEGVTVHRIQMEGFIDGEEEQLDSCCSGGGTRIIQIHRVVAKLPICSLGSADKHQNEKTSARQVLAETVIMADEAAVVEEGISPVQSPLVEVSFQKNVNRKQKYLEAEPKALGITQICLSLFNITCASVFLANRVCRLPPQIPFLVSSLLVLIAGIVAVAGQNLHLPTLRACLGMQIVACCASLINMICTIVKMEYASYFCWNTHHSYNESFDYEDICYQLRDAQMPFYAESEVIQALLFAISVTLAAYCCKVVNCCSPTPKTPVITVQAPQTSKEETVGYMTSAEE
ncbi:uncharacterized protein LOC113157535 [Anabas testudineus]|uniref:Uncharacterized protein n=1 Tax=Anabas testudineus TaxID=64144 RepID=A0A7N6AD99_ANATE|nr:uncharacterized protein LOC113157535 [Anabas testudineus]